jgi:hypothetical protein
VADDDDLLGDGETPPSARDAAGAQDGEESGVESGFDPQPSPSAPAPITSPQLTKLNILIKEHQMSREEGLGFYEGITGRQVASSKDLTKVEASQIIDALESDNIGGTDADDLLGGGE